MHDLTVDFAEIIRSPWAIAAALVLAGYLAGRIFVGIARPLLKRAAARSDWTWDDALVDLVGTPISILISLQVLRAVTPTLPIEWRAVEIVITSVNIATTIVIVWIAFRIVDVGRRVLEARAWAASEPAARSLLAIGARLLKVILLVIALIILLAYLGVSVASLVAGLGIGGLAIALAAQKTGENLFGTLSIGVDQPLREGDFVRIGETLGTVEAVGLRSTRIRTLDRTLVAIPNGKLADERIESYTVRDRMRLAAILGLVYDTSSAQMRRVLEELEATLRRHPKIWPDTVVVRFQKFGESSLDIEVMAWFQTQDWGEFQLIRQEVLLQFMEVVEAAGTSFAFPTRTLHVRHDDSCPRSQTGSAGTPTAG